MKRSLAVIAIALTLSSCISTSSPHVVGTLPIADATKDGKACSIYILGGLIQLGNASIKEAVKDAEPSSISQISVVDRSHFSFFGIFGKRCTYVYGK